jgi:26S proteasome regulatory subunit T4
MATNRPDVLDPALLRPGRLDRKVEIPLPNEAARYDIIKIHAKPITTKGEIDFEAIAKIGEDFNGADLRNVCTEAGNIIYLENNLLFKNIHFLLLFVL